MERDIFEPRLPSYLFKEKRKDHKINLLTLKDLENNDASKYGLVGSPTQVEKIFEPQACDETTTIKEVH